MAQPELHQDAAEAVDNAAIGTILQKGNLSQRLATGKLLQNGPFVAREPVSIGALKGARFHQAVLKPCCVHLTFEHMKRTCRFAEETRVIIISPDQQPRRQEGGIQAMSS